MEVRLRMGFRDVVDGFVVAVVGWDTAVLWRESAGKDIKEVANYNRIYKNFGGRRWKNRTGKERRKAQR